MKLLPLILIGLLFTFNTYAQNNTSFEQLEKKVSSTFFNTPEKAKTNAYSLRELAQTNYEIQTSYKYLGYIYDLTGKADSARYYLNQRLTFNKIHFFKELPYYEAVISYSNWGLEHIEYEILLKELTDALATIEINEFDKQKGLMYLLMGDVFLRERDLDNASEYFDKSFALVKGEYIKIDYYHRKSSVAILKNEFQEAQKFLLKGIALFNDKNIYTYPSFLNKLSYAYIRLGNYPKAYEYLQESLHYQEKNNFKTFRAKTYLYLAYWSKLNNTLEEKNYLDKALSFNFKDPEVTKELYLAYMDYYSRNENFFKAQEYQAKFNNLNDSLFNSEKTKIKLNLESHYKLSESKKEIAYKEQIINNNEKIKTLYAISLILLTLFLISLIILFWIKNRTHKKNREIQQLLHEEQLNNTLENQKTEIIKEKIKAKVEERERLSLELHDGIASEISALKLSLSFEHNENNKLLETTIDKIDHLYHEVRNLSHNLNPDSITEIEFTQLVEKICVIAENSNIIIERNIIISQKIDDLNEHMLLNLYRILQELIHNLIKHSNATHAKLEVIELQSSLFIEVSDNGDGIKSSNKKGIGLNNIQKRVNSLNGTLKVLSKNGVQFQINIPISK